MRAALVSVILGPFALWLAYSVIAALRGGVADAHGFRYARSTRPVMFWLTVAGQLSFVLLFAYLLYAQLRS